MCRYVLLLRTRKHRCTGIYCCCAQDTIVTAIVCTGINCCAPDNIGVPVFTAVAHKTTLVYRYLLLLRTRQHWFTGIYCCCAQDNIAFGCTGIYCCCAQDNIGVPVFIAVAHKTTLVYRYLLLLRTRQHWVYRYLLLLRTRQHWCTRVGIKKPTQKNPPKKPKKTHLKKPTKNGVFWVFLIFLFFMKIIQTFLFQTDFL